MRNAHGVAIVESITRWGVAAASAATSCARVSGLVKVSANTRRVSGRLAGRRVGFDVHVHEADETGIALSASGPVAFDVAYQLSHATGGGSEVHASVSVRSGGGITGRLLAEATGALLSAGALQAALGRIAREAAYC